MQELAPCHHCQDLCTPGIHSPTVTELPHLQQKILAMEQDIGPGIPPSPPPCRCGLCELPGSWHLFLQCGILLLEGECLNEWDTPHQVSLRPVLCCNTWRFHSTIRASSNAD